MTTISQIPLEALALEPTDLLEIEQGGVSKKISAETLLASAGDVIRFTQTGTGAVDRSLVEKEQERLSPLDFGAVGDGVANDTAAFKLLKTANPLKRAVDLCGRTYSLVSSVTDVVNGIALNSDFFNGKLLMDGYPLVFDKTQNFATSAAAGSRVPIPETNKLLGLKCNSANEYEIWRPLGGRYWHQSILRRTGAGIPLNWQEQRVKQVLGYLAAEDAGATYTGTWSTLTGTTGLSDGSGNLYIGGRARQGTAAGDYVEIPYTGGGDIYVVYAGRTSGNYVNVLLDGAQTYLTLPDDGSGNRYFDSYNAVDLSYKTVVKIAGGVPVGSHTIRLTISATKNGSSTGNRFVFNALSFDDGVIGAWDSRTGAVTWATGQTILLNQVRKYGNNHYYATVAGTTGATPPTHGSGAVSDGGVTWTFRTITSFDLVDSAIQVAGSQLEYAYEIQPDGAAALEDVGGALHGNEVQTALTISVDNFPITPIVGTWSIGDVVGFKEVGYSTHSEIGGGTAPIIHTTMIRTFKRGYVDMHHNNEVAVESTFGYYYPHMLPLLHYHGAANKYAVQKVWSSGDGYKESADYYGISNPIVGRTKDTLMVAYGECLQPNGSGGVPSNIPAPLSFAAWVSVDPTSVDYYDNANSIYAGKAMNTSGIDVSAGGFSSSTTKLYFEKYAGNNPQTLPVGYSWDCFARYGFDIFTN